MFCERMKVYRYTCRRMPLKWADERSLDDTSGDRSKKSRIADLLRDVSCRVTVCRGANTTSPPSEPQTPPPLLPATIATIAISLFRKIRLLFFLIKNVHIYFFLTNNKALQVSFHTRALAFCIQCLAIVLRFYHISITRRPRYMLYLYKRILFTSLLTYVNTKIDPKLHIMYRL